MKTFSKSISVLCVLLVAGFASGDEFVIEVNQSIGPDPQELSGSWVFPPNPLGFLVAIDSVSIDIQHSSAGDIEFFFGPGDGNDFNMVDNQGGDAILDGEYTFVEFGGAPAGSWGDGRGLYNANDGTVFGAGGIWEDDQTWTWVVRDTVVGNEGFVGSITFGFTGGIIPEPSSTALLGVCLIGGWMRRRR